MSEVTTAPAPARDERTELQERLTRWLDPPLAVLAFVMLGLLVVQWLGVPSPTWDARITQAQTGIWVIFLAAFLVEFGLAPSKKRYLRSHWLTALSVLLPVLRVGRVIRVLRVLRGLNLFRLLTTLNRSTRALETIARYGQLGYVLLVTALVTLAAAAGGYYFDLGEPQAGLRSPGDALWWAASLVTTINSSLEPVSLEGRVIGFLLRLFAVGVGGYLTAAIAVHLLGIRLGEGEANSTARELSELRTQIAQLEQVVRKLPGSASITDEEITDQDSRKT
jgi:voltage-gated potassium channel